MRLSLMLVLVFPLVANADVLDDFEYDYLEDGDWSIIEQTGIIAEIEIVSDAAYSGSHALYLESKNQDHFGTVPCERQKFCAIEKVLPVQTSSITIGYRFWVEWQGNSGPYNHAFSSGYAAIGLADVSGCTDFEFECIEACANSALVETDEWTQDGLQFYYDYTDVGTDGEVWYFKVIEVPEDSDPESLLFDLVVNTNAWSEHSDYAFTHIKLWVDFLTYETEGVSAMEGSWSFLKMAY